MIINLYMEMEDPQGMRINYKFLNATPDDLVGAFEKVGADSNGYFESFFNGKVII